jgi:hypothetical protein
LRDPRRAAVEAVTRISDQATPHIQEGVLPMLREMVAQGGGLEHVAMLVHAVNEYCETVEMVQGTRAYVRSAALAWIETQQSHDPVVIECVAQRLATDMTRSNTLATLQRSGDRAMRKAVMAYADFLRKSRRSWDKEMGNNSKRFDALLTGLENPPPSPQVINRLMELLSERGLI